MEFILSSALCSIGVALLLKRARDQGLDTWQLIGWNYAAALVLCVAFLLPASASVGALTQAPLPWFWLLLLALMLPSVFVAYAFALTHAGIIRSEIAQRLSLLIALGAAFSFMGDSLDWIKLAGLSLGLLAVGLLLPITRHSRNAPAISWRAAAALVAVWVGYGCIDITLKQIAASGVDLGTALSIAFAGAGGIMLTAVSLRRGRRQPPATAKTWPTHFAVGLVLGGLNFANIFLYLQAHRHFADQPAVVFASMNFLVVGLGVISARVLFNEPISRLTGLALFMCFAAIGLLTMTQ